MSRATEQASDFTVSTPHVLASAVTSQAVTLASLDVVAPTFIMLHAQGCAAHIRFGTSTSDTVSGVSVDTVAAFVATPPAPNTNPHVSLVDGERIRVRVPPGATHLIHIESAVSGYLRVTPATGAG